MDSLDSTSLPSILILSHFHYLFSPSPPTLSPLIASGPVSHPTCSYRPPPSTRSFSNVLHTDCTSTPLPLCPLYFIAGLILVRLPTAGLDPVTPHPCSIIPFRSHPGRCTFPCCDCHLDLSYCSYHNILHRQKSMQPDAVTRFPCFYVWTSFTPWSLSPLLPYCQPTLYS